MPNSLNAAAIAIPGLALPACVLCIPPLAAHINARNVAATILVIGTITINLQNFINALIWSSQPLEEKWDGKGLCDVEIKLYIGFGMAIVGASASIFRQLAIILDTDRVTILPSKAQKRRTLLFELAFCVGLPVFLMLVHYAVQPGRYWIVTVSGCTPSFHSSWPSYVLVLMWPVVVALVAAIYCSLAVFRLLRYRRQISHILSSSSSITKARYVRLFALASALLVAYLPLSVYSLVSNLRYPQFAYRWSAVHPPGWSNYIHRQSLDHEYTGFDRWVQIGTGYALFLFFGLGQEAISMYKSWLRYLGLSRYFPGLDSRLATSTSSRKLSSAHSPLVHKNARTNLRESRRSNQDDRYPAANSIAGTELGIVRRELN